MLTAFDIFAATPRAAARVIAERSVLMLGYWDALLLSAAAEAGCRTLVSEDMTSGETYFGVRVVSPFDPAGRPSPAIIDLLEL